jgi:hypothetical protein
VGADGKPAVPQTRDVVGVAQFDESGIESRLADLALPADAPLSVIAVELFPGDHLSLQSFSLGDAKVFYTIDTPDPFAGAAPATAIVGPVGVAASDALGRDLGTRASRRILRCSPLTPVKAAC